MSAKPMSRPMIRQTARYKVAAAALLTLAVLSGCGDKEAAKPRDAAPAAGAKGPANARAVRTALVERRALAGGVSASGVLVSREEAAVSAEVTGYRVARVLVDTGAYVRAGQPLVQLDDTLIRAQVDQARALAEQAEVAARQAASQAERVRGLDGTGALAQEQIDQRRFNAESTRAAANAQAASLRDLQARASKMTVRAPVSGIVLERTVRPGDLSGTGGAPMFRIARDGLVELDAQVAESSLPSIRIGAPATVSLPDGRSVQGVVRLIGPSVQADSKLGNVRVALPAGQGLRPGGFGQAVFGDLSASTLSVPETALRYDADGVSVMVVGAGNKVARVPVKTGRRGGGYAELVSGPAEGTRVLLGASSIVLEGDVVKPVDAPAAPARPAAK
jgi:HlyD family secretion protein